MIRQPMKKLAFITIITVIGAILIHKYSSKDQAKDAALNDFVAIHQYVVRTRPQQRLPNLTFYHGLAEVKVDGCHWGPGRRISFNITGTEWLPTEYIVHISTDLTAANFICNVRATEPSRVLYDDKTKLTFGPGSVLTDYMTALVGDPCLVSYKELLVRGTLDGMDSHSQTVKILLKDVGKRMLAAYNNYLSYFNWEVRNFPLDQARCNRLSQIARMVTW